MYIICSEGTGIEEFQMVSRILVCIYSLTLLHDELQATREISRL
jgi:hypothetical protein